MEILKNIVTKSKCFLEKAVDGVENAKKECDDYFKEVDLFFKTGDAGFFKSINDKENVEQIIAPSKRRGRSRKPALADVTENNIIQTEVIIKKEKLSNIHEIQEESNLNVQVKKEIEEMPAPTKIPPRKKKVKTEKLDVPKRSTRTRSKKNEANEDTSSDCENPRSTKYSDVIIQNTTITTIDLSDNEREAESDVEKTTNHKIDTRSTRSKVRKQNKPESEQLVKQVLNKEIDEEKAAKTRSTRTKTKQKKRTRSFSLEPLSEIESKRSRSNSNTEKEGNATVGTEYEDALSVLNNNQDKLASVNTTFVTSSNSPNAVPSNINSTVVVENPKMVTKDIEQLESGKPLENDVLTRTPPRPVKKTGNKQIFSPFEKTSLKKKVEAFERLGTESSGIPTRLTRTKKKAEQNETEHTEQNEENATKPVEENKHYFEREKVLTPLMTKFIPKVCSTSKINKLHPNKTSSSNESLVSARSASALKASQAEFREREKRRLEKESEALKKREALLQAQSEEKRRKREEKQQRAQQQRENLEKEMQKQLEAQRIKEEKFKQAMAEREKRHQKQKEEAEKKRLLAKKKAHELLKEKEEMMKMAEQKKYAEMKAIYDKQGEMSKMALKQKMERAHQQVLPIYMTTKPPLLPTVDCYDSDDPEYDLNKRVEHPWTKERGLRDMQMAMITVGETIKNSFFCRQAQTPDLQEIFELIDPKKLKRTSSAIWRKPPRYTLMPTLEDTIEFSEDSD